MNQNVERKITLGFLYYNEHTTLKTAKIALR